MAKNLSKQTAKFIAMIAETLPELSGRAMQSLIEHPGKLAHLLLSLVPLLSEFVKGQKVFGKMELLKLLPDWDFMILRSADYPEVGIAVSERSDSCGHGWNLVFRNDKGEEETFRAPCGCCNFSGKLDDRESRAKIIRDACKSSGIKFLVFHCWKSVYRESSTEDAIQWIEPNDEDSTLRFLDLPRFQNAFHGLLRVGSLYSEESMSLAEYHDRRKKQ